MSPGGRLPPRPAATFLTGLFHTFLQPEHAFSAKTHSGLVLPEITQIFEDPLVSDVAVAPSSLSVRRGGVWIELPPERLGWLQKLELEDFCIELVERFGGRLDFRVPLATVVCHGLRAHAVLGSALGVSTVLTLRRLGQNRPFICVDSASRERYSRLVECLTARNNVLIAGPAGSGKTTLLRSLLNQFSQERVITIEDAAELVLNSQNAVSLLSRVANVEGQGEIGLDRLLIEALRMSPDRIAVGEVRGSELVTMLDALNTGHSGAGATIHANSLVAVASRMLSIGARAGLSSEALSMQVIDAFSLVAFVSRDHRIESIGRFSLRDGRLDVQPID